jgi:signal transduction histidine kinase
VAAADGARVFDRFWSGDAARAGVGTHCGLGLALAQRVMELLGHEICVATEAGGWFRVRLRFPAAPIPIPEGRAKNLPPGLSPGRCQHEQETP